MAGDQPVSWLMFFTLVAAIVVAAAVFVRFLQSRHNRDIAANALAEGGLTARGSTPRGALPELAGVAVVALIAMGLLTAGYASKSTGEKRQTAEPVGTTTTGMAQPVGTAERPKTYQPANPAPDLRVAPTGSDTGSGAANGSTGTTR